MSQTKKKVRGSKVEVICRNARCGKKFMARKADVSRGWGKFCSKSCKATEQEKRTGQHANYQNRSRERQEIDPSDDDYWNGKDD